MVGWWIMRRLVSGEGLLLGQRLGDESMTMGCACECMF